MTNTMNRRDFIRTSSAAIGATVLAAAVGNDSRAGLFTGRMKKAVKYHMINEDISVEDKLKLLKDIGYDGVEIRVKDKIDKNELRRASESTGIPVHGIVNGSVEAIENAVDLAKFYGATSVLLVAGRVNENMPYAENYKVTQAKIAKAIPYAEKAGILLLIENVWNNFLLTPLEMRQYIDELGSETVGAYFDVGNVARYGWPEHWIPVLGERIRKLDIKPYSRKKQFNSGTWEGFKVELGDGDIDWAAVRNELDKIGYSGWATAEVPGGDRNKLAGIAARMDKVLDL